MVRQRCRYSDDDRANALAALAANGGNINRTARELGIPEKTLRNWANGTSHPEAANLAEQKKQPLAALLEDVARKLAGDLANGAAKDPAVALGIVIDKRQILLGQPTSITRSLSDAERADRLRALVEQFRASTQGVRPPDDSTTPPALALLPE